jgi:hypothetical protein
VASDYHFVRSLQQETGQSDNQKPQIKEQIIQWPQETGQSGNQKPQIKEQTIQWPQETRQRGNQIVLSVL